jgi:hypothetical protein
MRLLCTTLVAVTVVASQAGCVRRIVMPPLTEEEKRAELPPAGMVEVNVVSEYEDQVWDVYAGGQIVCTTPCTQWLKAHQHVALKAHDGDRIDVPGLGLEALEARRAVLVAEGTCEGKQINGIVFTSLGSMGLITAITLTAVGCSDVLERRGMCNAGLITGAITLPLTAAAIWMIVDSMPRAHILPVFRTTAAAGQPPVTIAVGPTGIFGTF